MEDREIWEVSPLAVHKDTLDSLAYLMAAMDNTFKVSEEFLRPPPNPKEHRTANEVIEMRRLSPGRWGYRD